MSLGALVLIATAILTQHLTVQDSNYCSMPIGNPLDNGDTFLLCIQMPPGGIRNRSSNSAMCTSFPPGSELSVLSLSDARRIAWALADDMPDDTNTGNTSLFSISSTDVKAAPCYIVSTNRMSNDTWISEGNNTSCSATTTGYICAMNPNNTMSQTTTQSMGKDDNQTTTQSQGKDDNNATSYCTNWAKNDYNNVPDDYLRCYLPDPQVVSRIPDQTFCTVDRGYAVASAANIEEAREIAETLYLELPDPNTLGYHMYFRVNDTFGINTCYLLTGNRTGSAIQQAIVGSSELCTDKETGYVCLDLRSESTTPDNKDTTTEQRNWCNNWKENTYDYVPDEDYFRCYPPVPDANTRLSDQTFCNDAGGYAVASVADLQGARHIADIFISELPSPYTLGYHMYFRLDDSSAVNPCYLLTGNRTDTDTMAIIGSPSLCNDKHTGYVCLDLRSVSTTPDNKEVSTTNYPSMCNTFILHMPGNDAYSYEVACYEPDSYPASRIADAAFCSSVDQYVTAASADTYQDAYKIAVTLWYHIPDPRTAPVARVYRIEDSSGRVPCFIITGDKSNSPGSFIINGTQTHCDDKETNYVCKKENTASSTTDDTTYAGIDSTTGEFMFTTPAYDEVLTSLGLNNNASAADLLTAMNGVLDGGTTLSSTQLIGFGSVLGAATENADAEAMSDVLNTADTIFDAAGSASAQQVQGVAKSLMSILSNAVGSITSDTGNLTSNDTSTSDADLFNKTTKLADKMAIAVSSGLSETDDPVQLNSTRIGLTIAKKKPSNSNGTELDTGFGTVTLTGGSSTNGSLALQAVGLKEVPRTMKNSDANVDSAPLTFKVAGGSNETVDYSAASKLANKTIPVDEFDTSNITTADGILTQYKITDIYSFMKVSLIVPDETNVYTVRCNFKSAPSATNKSIEIVIDQTENTTLNEYNASITFNQTTGDLFLFLDNRKFNDTGFFYVRITAPPTTSTTRRRRAAGSASYSSSAAVYAPRVWDDVKQEWVISDDVAIDPSSSNEEVVFKSNYMGSITAGLIVPPNTIDFDEVFDDLGAKVAENPAVLIVVCLITGLYLILLVPIRWLDVQDYRKWQFLPILHNRPEDNYVYQISIALGPNSSQEFDIPVFCVLYGSKGKTNPRTLDDGKRQLFRPGMITNLCMTSQEDIGEITHIHVWTLARDDRDSIYVEYINVVDVLISTTYTFLCNDWISPNETLCYGHEIFLVNATEGKDFVSLMKHNAKSKLFDDHLWLSVAKRPKKSNFSRVQRLSMCMSTLFLTMVVNAMFFPTDGVEDDAPAFSIGPIRITMRTLFVAVIGNCIVIPPNLLIIFLFKRSRPFIKPGSHQIGQEKKMRLPIEIQDLETEGDVKKENGSVSEEDSMTNSQAQLTTNPTQKPWRPWRSSSTEIEKTGKDEEPKTKEEMEAELKKIKRKNNKPFSLPWFGIIFGYIMVGVCIFNGAWWCFLYSIQWGKTISGEWLASLALSVFSSILIMEPVKVIIIAMLISFFLQDDTTETDETALINTVSDLYGKVRPIESLEPPIIPQSAPKEDPIVMYSEHKLHTKLMDKLKGVATHIFYLILLLYIATHNQDIHFYRQNANIKATFGFEEMGLSRIEDIYVHMREEIFPLIYPREDYRGEALSAYDQNFIENCFGLLMGPTRIKQYREKDLPCNELDRVSTATSMKVHICRTETENDDWNTNWNGTFISGNFEDPAYIHDKLSGSKIHGTVNSYPVSGYGLEVQRWNYLILLAHLESNTWIDKQSREVSVEFVINNMNVNTWTMVKIYYEMPIYGGVFTSYSVSSFRPYPFRDTRDFIFLAVYCIFALIVLWIIFCQIKAFIKQGCRIYFTDLWHWIELINISLSIASMTLFVLRAFSVIASVEYMMNNRGKYADFDATMNIDDNYGKCLAFLLFFSILQLFQPMDFSRELTAIKMALKMTGPTIITYSTIFVALLLCYSHTMTIAFGTTFSVFNEMFHSLYYLFGMLLGVVKYADVIEEDTTVLRIMFAFYMILGNMILLNLFIAVICEGLAYMGDSPDDGFDQEMSEYIGNKLNGWWAMFSGAHKKGPKMAKVRRGGPWNRQLEIYYSLLEEDQVTPIEEETAENFQKNVDTKSEQVVEKLPVLDDTLTETELAAIPVCTTRPRNEQTVRLAIKTIILEMILSNNKMRGFVRTKPKTPPPPPIVKEEPFRLPTPPPKTPTPEPEPIPEPDEEDDLDILNQTSGKIGPEGGKLEVMPGTWVVIDKNTFTVPSKIEVQACTSPLFASYIISLETSEPLAKPFKVCLPFKDGKRRDYCNVFVRKDDNPWTLSYNSVTCYSDSLRCMCHAKSDERKFQIAAKAAQRKQGVAKAGLKLKETLVAAPIIKQMYEEEPDKLKEALAKSVGTKWKQEAEARMRQEDPERMPTSKWEKSLQNLDLV